MTEYIFIVLLCAFYLLLRIQMYLIRKKVDKMLSDERELINASWGELKQRNQDLIETSAYFKITLEELRMHARKNI